MGLFTSRKIIHNWVSKGDNGKFYEILYRFGINLIWVRFWISVSKSKEYSYTIKTKKTQKIKLSKQMKKMINKNIIAKKVNKDNL